jgi:hypothetical protein
MTTGGIVMPTFDTPQAISVGLEVGVGDVLIEASDRTETVVDVRPTDPARRGDVTAAEQTRVEFSAGRLVVKAPSKWRQWVSRRGDSIEVAIGLPSGSRVDAEAGVAAFRCRGRLGALRCKLGAGDIQLDEAASVDLKTGVGDVTVGRSVGKTEIVTGSGAVRIGSSDGVAFVKSANGDISIGEASGEVRIRSANGRISVDQAHAGVVAKTANGPILIGEVIQGAAVAQSAFGDIQIGIRDGVPAWLDLDTSFGVVHNGLDASSAPDSGVDSVRVQASTSHGDISVHRAFGAPEGADGT